MFYQCVVTPGVRVSGCALLKAVATSRLHPTTRLCERPLADLNTAKFRTLHGCPSSVSCQVTTGVCIVTRIALSEKAPLLFSLHRFYVVSFGGTHSHLAHGLANRVKYSAWPRKVKLVDFGCSCGAGLGVRQELDRGERINGTPAYWPPELVQCEDEGIPYNFTTAADMW